MWQTSPEYCKGSRKQKKKSGRMRCSSLAKHSIEYGKQWPISNFWHFRVLVPKLTRESEAKCIASNQNSETCVRHCKGSGNRAREAAACSVLARSYYEIEENDIAWNKVNKSWLQQMQKNFGRVVQGPVVRRPISA